MEATTQSFLMPLISLCLFFSVLFGSFYAITRLVALRSTNHSKALPAQTALGFAPPIILLLAWGFIFSEAISFNVIALVWLLLFAVSVVALVAKSARFAPFKGYAVGLLLGCCGFFICATILAMLD